MAQIKINNVDITTYGARPCKGFYEALLTPAPMKEYVSNNSRLTDGATVKAASTDAKKDSRELSLAFFVEGSSQSDYLSKYASFINAISAGEITLSVYKLNTAYKLVYTNCSQYGDFGIKCGKFVIKFKEFNPSNRTSLS